MLKTSQVFWFLKLYGFSRSGLSVFIVKVFIDSIVCFIVIKWLLAPTIIPDVYYIYMFIVCFLLYSFNPGLTVYLIKGFSDFKKLILNYFLPTILSNLTILLLGYTIAEIIHK